MAKKEFLGPRALLHDSFRLAKRIYDSGYRPEVLLALWRGGSPVGIAVHEFLLRKGIVTYHTVVKAESYLGIAQRGKTRVEHLDWVARSIPRDSRVLVVDDIFDSGCTMAKVCRTLRARTRSIKIATLFWKTGGDGAEHGPDFYVRKTGKWMVFPHELMELSSAELHAKDPFIGRVVAAKQKSEDRSRKSE